MGENKWLTGVISPPLIFPVPFIFGTRGLVTRYIGNWGPGSKYIIRELEDEGTINEVLGPYLQLAEAHFLWACHLSMWTPL